MGRRNLITHVTRRNIFDYLTMEGVAWAGRLEETQFVVRVWPSAADLPSYDTRYKDALGDIHQHRINNLDWDDDWIFADARFNLTGGSDQQFLAFLSETVHPVVRSDQGQVADLVAEFNRHLRPDGFQLAPVSYVSGKAIYAGVLTRGRHTPETALDLPTRTLLEDHSALMDHLDAIGRDIKTDPAGAIASAKDLLETMCKLILDKRQVSYGKDDLPVLYKKVSVELGLDRRAVSGHVKGSEAAAKTLGGLSSSVQGLSELRNQLGRGHGRTTPSPALERHARLAFNTSVALTEFLYDTLQDREDHGPR